MNSPNIMYPASSLSYIIRGVSLSDVSNLNFISNKHGPDSTRVNLTSSSSSHRAWIRLIRLLVVILVVASEVELREPGPSALFVSLWKYRQAVEAVDIGSVVQVRFTVHWFNVIGTMGRWASIFLFGLLTDRLSVRLSTVLLWIPVAVVFCLTI